MGAWCHKAGGTEVWCLQDGSTVFDPSVFPGLGAGLRQARLEQAGLTGIDTAFNAYLLRHADGAVDLVDAGCGTRFGPGAGLLLSRLKALGVQPGDIRSLIFTHLHGDHCGGAVLDGKPVYPNAQVCLHRAEIGPYGEDEAGGALLAAYDGRITPLDGDETLPGGLKVWPLPGHAPGHIGLWVGESFALVGDILHSFALQLPDPDLCPVYDNDPAQARATRRAALAHLARTGAVWSGSHGIGQRFVRAIRDGAGYRTEAA